jgi:holo-[acyl-carrier protein] synthase
MPYDNRSRRLGLRKRAEDGKVLYGIGIDVVRICRIERIWSRSKELFAETILMEQEYALFEAEEHPARFLASRFAAKEAIAKAMGLGFSDGIWVRDLGTVPDSRGRPTIVLSDRGSRKCDELGIGGGYLSLSESRAQVFAMAMLTIGSQGGTFQRPKKEAG